MPLNNDDGVDSWNGSRLKSWVQSPSASAPSSSVTSGSRGGRCGRGSGGVSRRLPPPGASDWLSKMMVEPESPVDRENVQCSRMSLHAPAPPDPMTLRQMYDAYYEVIHSPKWRVQLLDRAYHRRSSATDMAEMVLALEEGELSTMLAFPKSDGTDLYMSSESGVWSLVESKDHHEVYHALTVLTERMDRMVISACKALLKRLRSALSGALATSLGAEALSEAMREAEDHLSDVVRVFEQLRTPAVASNVVKRLVTSRVMETKGSGITASKLDTAPFCVAFTDGVYDFGCDRLLRDGAARALYQTLTTGYANEDLEVSVGASDDGKEGYERFMLQIFSSAPEIRGYVIDLLASSILNENRQVIVIHYNITGANGKSKLFELIQSALGGLFMKCQSTVLNRASITTPSAPNEGASRCGHLRAFVSTEVQRQHDQGADRRRRAVYARPPRQEADVRVQRHAARPVQQDPRVRRHGRRHGASNPRHPVRVDVRLRPPSGRRVRAPLPLQGYDLSAFPQVAHSPDARGDGRGCGAHGADPSF